MSLLRLIEDTLVSLGFEIALRLPQKSDPANSRPYGKLSISDGDQKFWGDAPRAEARIYCAKQIPIDAFQEEVDRLTSRIEVAPRDITSLDRFKDKTCDIEYVEFPSLSWQENVAEISATIETNYLVDDAGTGKLANEITKVLRRDILVRLYPDPVMARKMSGYSQTFRAIPLFVLDAILKAETPKEKENLLYNYWYHVKHNTMGMLLDGKQRVCDVEHPGGNTYSMYKTSW